MTVKYILKGKGNSVATIKPSKTKNAVISQLAYEGVEALVVSLGGKKVDGIGFEREIVRGLKFGLVHSRNKVTSVYQWKSIK
jgi:hypothetical protein